MGLAERLPVLLITAASLLAKCGSFFKKYNGIKVQPTDWNKTEKKHLEVLVEQRRHIHKVFVYLFLFNGEKENGSPSVTQVKFSFKDSLKENAQMFFTVGK